MNEMFLVKLRESIWITVFFFFTVDTKSTALHTRQFFSLHDHKSTNSWPD